MKTTVSDPTIVPFLTTIFVLVVALAITVYFGWRQKRQLKKLLGERLLESDHQQQMLRTQLESQEHERRRVAKDLHDEVGLMLQALRTTMLAILHEAPEADRKEVQQLVTEVSESVRRICWELMPGSLEYFGLTEAVDEMCHRLTASGPVPLTFSVEGRPSLIAKNKQTLLYRMVQETVTNALKHSSAQHVDVKFSWTSDHLLINVLDDGVGFDPKKNNTPPPLEGGLGLRSLENCAVLLNADLAFENNFPHGTNVSVTYPIRSHG